MKRLCRLIPRYAVVPLIAIFCWNSIVYNGAILLMRDAEKWDMTTALDRIIPLQIGWIWVYFGCFLFWGIHYILIARRGRELWFRFFWADIAAELVCGLCFVLLPTTNLRPEVVGGGISAQLVRFLFRADPAQNLFPSIHCMVSWFCFLGLRTESRLPRWYRAAVGLFALAVCASTLFLKQHVLPDVISGVALAELSWWVSGRVQKTFRQKQNSFSKSIANRDGNE